MRVKVVSYPTEDVIGQEGTAVSVGNLYLTVILDNDVLGFSEYLFSLAEVEQTDVDL